MQKDNLKGKDEILTIEDFDRMLREVGVVPQNEQYDLNQDSQGYKIKQFSLLDEDPGSTIVTLQ